MLEHCLPSTRVVQMVNYLDLYVPIDLLMIKPNYEAMIKGGHLKVTEMGVQHVGEYAKSDINVAPII